MGWSQSLGHKGITKEQVETVLNAIKAKGFFGGKWQRQDSGWHSECDIDLYPRYVRFSGSWGMSGDTDLPERFLSKAKAMNMPVGSALSKRS